MTKLIAPSKIAHTPGQEVSVLFFGESPGPDEYKDGHAFVGKAGKLLRDLIHGHFPLRTCVLDNVCPEWLGGIKNKPTKEKLEEYRPYVLASIKKHKPRVIVLLGEHAFKSFGLTLKPVANASRVIFNRAKDVDPDVPVVLSVHPAWVIRGNVQGLTLIRRTLHSVQGCLKKKNPLQWEQVTDLTYLATKLGHLAKKLCSLDLETTSIRPGEGRILTAAIACDDPKKAAFWFPLFHQEAWDQETERRLRLLQKWWPKGPRVAHNAKFELAWMRSVGAKDPKVLYDTLIQAWLLDENEPRNLEQQILYHLEAKPYWQGIPRVKAEVPLADLGPYNAADAWYCLKLHRDQRVRMDPTLNDLADKMFFPLIRVLETVQTNGIKVDLDELARTGKQVKRKVSVLKKMVRSRYPDLNVRSHVQMSTLLYDKMGLTPLYRTAKGARSTDMEVLEQLAQEHPEVQPLAQLRKIQSLQSRIYNAWPKLASADGYLHTSLNLGATVTGRLSSSEPNLQNVDVGGPQRTAMVSRWVGGRILQADYSQHELRIVAACAGIEKLMEEFSKGEKADPHQVTADLLGCPRPTAKNVNFGIIFDITPHGLKQKYRIPVDEGRELIATWYEKYPELGLFHEQLEKDMAEYGYVENAFGLRRRLENPGNQRERRQAYNFPVQSLAVMICHAAIIKLDKAMRKLKCASVIIHQEHDKLILDVAPGEVKGLSKLVKETMLGVPVMRMSRRAGNPLPYDVPLAVEVKVGEHF